jgi:3-deoxy-D-manno-octulosonate 8-phosphate phosphatase (KDO 8-P phosphatase)
MRDNQEIYVLAKAIRLVAFDVDGVMTDGGLCYTDSGEEFKIFNARDGHGMKMLQESGVKIAIITSRQSRAVELRARNLGVDFLHQGVSAKLETFQSMLTSLGLDLSAASYMGDDVIDLPVLRRCGLAISVPDAPAIVREHVHYITHARGGHGAVREATEFIMHAQGTLQARLDEYLA